MTDKYHVSNYISFTVNDIACSLHKEIASQMSIFAALTDCKTTDELKLVWDVSEENRVRTFNCLCDEKFEDNVDIESFVDIFKFMGYMGFTTELFSRVTSKLKRRSVTVEEFIEHFKSYNYSEETCHLLELFIPIVPSSKICSKNGIFQRLIDNFSAKNRLYIMANKLIDELDYSNSFRTEYVWGAKKLSDKIKHIMQCASDSSDNKYETCSSLCLQDISSLTQREFDRQFDFHFCYAQNTCTFLVDSKLVSTVSHSDEEYADERVTICYYVASLIMKTDFSGVCIKDLCEKSYDECSSYSSDY